MTVSRAGRSAARTMAVIPEQWGKFQSSQWTFEFRSEVPTKLVRGKPLRGSWSLSASLDSQEEGHLNTVSEMQSKHKSSKTNDHLPPGPTC